MLTEQLTLDAAAGEAAKAAGQDLTEGTQESFIARMREAAIDICRRTGSVSTDELRVYAEAHGIAPPVNRNAYGAIFRGPHWVEIGRKRSAIVSNHAREIRIWSYHA